MRTVARSTLSFFRYYYGKVIGDLSTSLLGNAQCTYLRHEFVTILFIFIVGLIMAALLVAVSEVFLGKIPEVYYFFTELQKEDI